MSKLHYNTDSNCNNYTDSRFTQLSQKISKIQNYELKNPNTFSGLESKIDYLEVNVLRTIKDFGFKTKFLEDEMFLLSKMIDDEKCDKETLRKKISLELNNFEIKVKKLFEIERENLKSFAQSLIKTVEEEVSKMQNEINAEKEEILSQVAVLRDYMKIDMIKFTQMVEGNTENRKDEMNNLIQTMNDEFKYLNDLV
jgi:hypothetical protein